MFEYFGGSLVYSVVKDIYGRIIAGRRKLSPEQRLASRAKWKPQFEDAILRKTRDNVGTDVIVRDVRRLDEYPEGKPTKKGISAWFKAGLMSTYDRGILLGLSWVSLAKTPTGWRDASNEMPAPEGAITVILAGRVRYEDIEDVDWTGDDFYWKPQIYCHFAHKGEPYEDVAYYQEHQNPGGPKFYSKVADWKTVKRR